MYNYIKPILRIFLLVVFVTSSISVSVTFSWTSLISAFFLFLTYIKFKLKAKSGEQIKQSFYTSWEFFNPYKGKTGKKDLDREKEKEFILALNDYLLYHAAEAKSIDNFQVMKCQSECVFAKRAQVWGSPDYNVKDTLEENIKSLYPTFLKFTSSFQNLGLDGFVIELPGKLYGKDIKIFGDAIRRTLLTLKTCDNIRKCNKMKRAHAAATTSSNSSSLSSPLQIISENTNKWNSKYWVFEIHMTTFFITTFAPFYPKTNSRYNFGLEHCYILFQPEISFAVHDLPPDTPFTNWQHPVTIRDRIRKAFHDKGREYTPPLADGEPMVYDMVKRIEPEDEQTMWWLDSVQNKKNYR